MKTVAIRVFAALLLATTIASCSTPVLESIDIKPVALETPQASDLLNGGVNDTLADGGADGDTALEASATPCFTYKVKKYEVNLSQHDTYTYGMFEVTKSPSCKSKLNVSFEGKFTSPGTRPEDRITAYFDNPMYNYGSNTYYCYYSIYLGTHPKPGSYGVAFRVKGGNVNKAVIAVKLNVNSGW
jgi:hypothetical protein